MGTFEAPQDIFLVFEEGPSIPMQLQWATYYDAADQCSLSRIWGGIHPPADDLPGRLIGHRVGTDAYDRAARLFRGEGPPRDARPALAHAQPTPVRSGGSVRLAAPGIEPFDLTVFDLMGRAVLRRSLATHEPALVSTSGWPAGTYVARLTGHGGVSTTRIVVTR
jgi:hypothetical protein